MCGDVFEFFLGRKSANRADLKLAQHLNIMRFLAVMSHYMSGCVALPEDCDYCLLGMVSFNANVCGGSINWRGLEKLKPGQKTSMTLFVVGKGWANMCKSCTSPEMAP